MKIVGWMYGALFVILLFSGKLRIFSLVSFAFKQQSSKNMLFISQQLEF